MLKFLNILFIFFAATVINWICLLLFSSVGINVGIMLSFCLIMATLLNEPGAYTFAFLSGLFLDFFCSSLFGAHALVLTLVMFIFYVIHDKIDFKDIGPQMVVAFVLNIICVLFYGFLGSVFVGSFIWQGFKSLILGSIATGLIIPLLYMITVKYLEFKPLRGTDNENKTIF